MSTQKSPYVPKIGQKIYIRRKDSLGNDIFFEAKVTRIRIEVKCLDSNFMTVTSPHLIERSGKGLLIAKGGNLF